MIYKIILFASLPLGAIGQLLLKAGMRKANLHYTGLKKLWKIIITMFTNPYVFSGAMCFVLGTLIWLLVLSNLELSYAYPIVALNYFFASFFARLLFHEHVTKKRWLAIFIFVCGILVMNL